jgi:hypothetical protein
MRDYQLGDELENLLGFNMYFIGISNELTTDGTTNTNV